MAVFSPLDWRLQQQRPPGTQPYTFTQPGSIKPSALSYPLPPSPGPANFYPGRLPIPPPPSHSQFDDMQRISNAHFEVTHNPAGHNLEQELNAASERLDASTRAGGHNETGELPREPSRHQPHHVAQRAEEYLDDWHKRLDVLTTQSGCEANKADILDHVNAMYGWLRQEILPGVQILQAYTQGLMDRSEEAEKDNGTLLAQLRTVRREYADLFEAYMEEFEASREKTRNLGEAMARFEAGLKRARGCVVDSSTKEILEVVGQGAAREWLAKDAASTA